MEGKEGPLGKGIIATIDSLAQLAEDEANMRYFPLTVLVAVSWMSQVPSSAPQTSSVSDVRSQELKLYGSAQPYLDESIPVLKKTMRDLEGLKIAANQDSLPDVLSAAAENLREMLENLPDLLCNEAVSQTEWEESQKPICGGMSGCVDPKPIEEKNQNFDYIILAHPEGDRHLLLEEYRRTRDDRPITVAEEPHFKGFASLWFIFASSNLAESHFRYLGEQKENGRATFVVAFAQIPGLVKSPPTIVTAKGSIPMLLQGLAWFDQKEGRVVRLRADLLSPQPEIGYDEQTSNLQFGTARIPTVGANFWLPETVRIKSTAEGRLWEERHHYSNFHLYKAKTKVILQPN